MKKILILILFISLNCFGQKDSLNITIPKIESSVSDFANLLELDQEIALKVTINNFKKKYKIGIVVVTVDSIEPYENIFDYSLILANQSNFNCVYIVICKDCREIQIQNCDMILDKLTNEETKQIITDYILPKFKNNEYFEGIWQGVSEIMNELR